MAETFTTKQFFATLEELGEEQVRLKLGLQHYGPQRADKAVLAEEWLRQKTRERLEERERIEDASNSENLRIAHSSKNAAWLAAAMASVAAIVAIVSAVIAYLALQQAS